MSEWWTYRLDDFLMFSPATYWRVIGQYHREVWPGQILGLIAGGLAVWLTASQKAEAGRIQAVLLAVIWLWIGWAFYLQKYLTIHWAAAYFALAFAAQAVLLLALGFMRSARAQSPNKTLRATGWVLAAAGLVFVPLASLWAGRPWSQVEIFGVSPHATAVATLGLLFVRQRAPPALLWGLAVVPVLSLLEGAATLTSLARMQGG